MLGITAGVDHGVPFRTVGELSETPLRQRRLSVTFPSKKQKTKKQTSGKSKRSLIPTPVPSPEHVRDRERCGFVEQSREDMESLHTNMTLILKEKKKTHRFYRGGNIKVYFHILKNVAGQGHISASQIAQQMAILNDAFADGQWSFTLMDVEYVVNNKWYQDLQNQATESEAKRALRRGTGEDLNVYSADLPSYLGWAYLPNYYDRVNGHFDGIVLHTGSFPDGFLTNYNLGDTGILK